MRPLLAPGGYGVFVRSTRLAAGDVVLADHPEFGAIVKMVTEVSGRLVRLAGLDPRSTPSERLGRIDASRIKGRLVWRIPPPRR